MPNESLSADAGPDDEETSAVDGLADAIGLKLPYDGSIGVAKGKWVVMIWAKRPTPALKEFRGKPVEYRIGGGKPRAL